MLVDASDPHLEREAAAIAYDEIAVGLWDAPLMDRVLPHLSLSEGTTALVVDCRTGYACQALQDTFSGVRVMAVDPCREMLDLTRRRLQGRSGVFFNSQPTNTLSYATGVFGLVTCLAAPVGAIDFNAAVAELNRVAQPGGHLALAFLAADSLAPVLDVLREAVGAFFEAERSAVLEGHLQRLLSPDDAVEFVKRRGATVVASGEEEIELSVGGDRHPLLHPVLRDALASVWSELAADPGFGVEPLRLAGEHLAVYLTGIAIEGQIRGHWLLAQTAETRVEEVFEMEELGIEEVEDSLVGSAEATESEGTEQQ